ncbi:MAG TPA: TonB family protein [Longimicrobiaceae bacterium]
MDSAQLVAALRSAGPAPAGTRIPSDFNLYFAAGGQVDSIRPAFRKLSADYAAAMEALIRPAVRPQPVQAEEWQFLLRAQGGRTVTLEEPDYEVSPPEILNRRAVTAALHQVRALLDSSPLDRERRLMVAMRMTVTEEGTIRDETLVRGTGDMRIDAEVLRILRKVRFRPATLDGIPVPVLITLPFTVYP